MSLDLGPNWLGRVEGLEPSAFGSTVQRSNQLSYTRHCEAMRESPRAVAGVKGFVVERFAAGVSSTG